MTTESPKSMLIILDGWGVGGAGDGNAVYLAKTPCLDRLMQTYPHTQLRCSGGAVGLPAGIMGNSEVGHLNIGAGRVVYQDLLRIDRAIQDRSFFNNAAFNDVMDRVKAERSALHLMGLLSDGGVHSQLTHLLALLDMAGEKALERVYVHAILDGRDTPPESGQGYMHTLNQYVRENGCGMIASICGRFYAMDRDRRWERVSRAYRLYTLGDGKVESDPEIAIAHAYQEGQTDEFVEPLSIRPEGSAAPVTVQDGDGIVFFNFRADRAREITQAFTDPEFDGFERKTVPDLCAYVCMTRYDETFPLACAFPPVHLDQILGEVISDQGLKQLRIAETEKYAHVTYFFNGGEERPFPLEDRCLIPSPRDVATYDQKPEMSAREVTREVLSRIRTGGYDFIVLNFANMDMVGHTGVLPAAIRAAETVDGCVNEIVSEMSRRGNVLMVTADHGNAEKMVDAKGKPHTAHTTHPVPFILVDDARRNVQLHSGSLCDIAPTVLDVMGIGQPDQMTGRSLIATR